MAEKKEWYGRIPDEAKSWLTFADQRDKGYEYNKYFTEITASTDDNGGEFPDEIKFVVGYNNTFNNRYCEVKFKQKDGTTNKCYISQNGTTFEQLWKHAPKGKTHKENPTDAVIAQSSAETSNDYEVAVGNFNRTRPNLLFSVGNGKDENNRQNSFEVDNEKIKADNGDINSLTADTFSAETLSATTICATNIVNVSGTNFVSYSASTTGSEQGAYPIGTLKINTEEIVISGINRDEEAIGIAKQANDKVDDLSGKTITRTEFGKLSDTVADYYNELVTGLTNSYSILNQSLSGLSEDVGRVETKYDTVSGQVLSLTSAMDAFNVSYNGLSNQVSAITTQYDNLSGQVISNTQNIGTLRATSDTISYGSLKVSKIFNGEGDIPSSMNPVDIKYAKVTPSYQKFTTSGTISASTQNVICKNTSDIVLTLPLRHFIGTEIRIWKFGRKVTLASQDYNILHNTNNGSDSDKSVTLDKNNALYIILFDGEDWLLT